MRAGQLMLSLGWAADCTATDHILLSGAHGSGTGAGAAASSGALEKEWGARALQVALSSKSGAIQASTGSNVTIWPRLTAARCISLVVPTFQRDKFSWQLPQLPPRSAFAADVKGQQHAN
nr:uncharacterized protein CTRU02_06815 [Colletotrichum truncatum]KAF6792198.1 hypothetical protein CTRU02_06815 [Colletotrichum truncatum]